jgi:CHAT domain-containing protein/tetratricopeptide (TPR) repeat protein
MLPRIATLSFSIVLLGAVARGGRAEALPVRLEDDFTANTLKQYQVTGEVTWQKGQVTLGPEAKLVLPLALGLTTEVRAAVRVPPGPAASELRLSLRGGPHQAGVALRATQGRTVLVSLEEPEKVATLDPPGAAQVGTPTVWDILIEAHYGLVRVKAWLRNAPEPKAWRSMRWIGHTIWEPLELAIEGGARAGGILEAFTVRGIAPARALTDVQRQQQSRACALDDEATALHQRGKSQEALSKAVDALRITREFLGPEHLATMNALNSVGLILSKMGRHAEALRYHEEGLAIRKKVLGPEHPGTAVALNNLAVLLYGMGRYGEARPCYEEALTIHKKMLGPEHPDTVRVLGNLGVLLQDMGRYAEARPHVEEALAICKKVLGPEHSQTAVALHNMGSVLTAMGRHAEARPYRERALAIYKKVLGAEHPHTAAALSAMGMLLQDMSKYGEARPYLEEALAIHKKVHGPEHPSTATALNNLGRLLQAMGKDAEARPYLEEALSTYKKVLGPEHPSTAMALNNLGMLLHDMGKYGEARPYLEEALSTYKKVLGPEHPATATALNNLGALLHAMGKYAEARPYSEEALTITKRVFGADHPRTAGSVANLGRLLCHLGQEREAWETLALASTTLAHYLARTTILSAQRDHAPLIDGRRRSLDVLLSLTEQSCLLTADQQHNLMANVLNWKALSTAVLSLRHEALLASTDRATAARFDHLRDLRQQLANLLLQGPGRLPPGEYRRQGDELRRQEDQLERDLAERVRGYRDWQRHRRAGPKDLAAELRPGEVLVELVQYRGYDFTATNPGQSWQPARYAAVLLWRAATEPAEPRIRFVPLGAAQPIDQTIHAWRVAVQGGAVAVPLDEDLRRRVWEPLAQALPAEAQRLFVVPDGELALLPFEAIRLADGRYLIEHLRLSYLSNGRDLRPRTFPRETSRTAVILADPDYDAVGAPAQRDPQQTGPSVPPAAAAALRSRDWTGARRFQSLPGFAREASAVTQLLQGQAGWTLQSYQREQASEETLSCVARPRLLYLITHGFFLADQERRLGPAGRGRDIELVDLSPSAWRLPAPGVDPRLGSGVALAGANRWQERAARGLSDGLLTALEVENLDLWGTELVVLSACETGLGAIKVGEGVLGLRRAFEQAGAQTVLASLWKVPDTETETLMGQFFQRWLKGAPKAEAWRQAQLALIRQLRADPDPALRAAPPLYWAGFVCHGQSR